MDSLAPGGNIGVPTSETVAPAAAVQVERARSLHGNAAAGHSQNRRRNLEPDAPEETLAQCDEGLMTGVEFGLTLEGLSSKKLSGEAMSSSLGEAPRAGAGIWLMIRSGRVKACVPLVAVGCRSLVGVCIAVRRPVSPPPPPQR